MQTLWICATQRIAVGRRKGLGNPANVHFVGVGAALGGRRFDEIILDTPLTWASTVLTEHARSWYRDAVVCRLLPGGKMKTLTSLDDPYMNTI